MTLLWRRVMELLRPARFDRDAAAEMTHHVELHAEEKRRRGLDPVEARRLALVELGSVAQTREQMAEGRAGFHLEQLLRDVIYAARVLRRTPDRLAALDRDAARWPSASARCSSRSSITCCCGRCPTRPPIGSCASSTAIRRRASRRAARPAATSTTGAPDHAFRDIAATYATGRTLSTDARAEVVLTAQVSEDFFDLFGVSPLIGRTFTADETRTRAVQQRRAADRRGPGRAPVRGRVAPALRRRSRTSSGARSRSSGGRSASSA